MDNFSHLRSDCPAQAVLVVDDIPGNIGVLRSLLQPHGHQIFVATSGEAALTIAAEVALDLILLDVMMPGMDGFETCKRLKGNPQTQDIPVVFVTARTDSRDVIDGFALGAVLAAEYIAGKQGLFTMQDVLGIK